MELKTRDQIDAMAATSPADIHAARPAMTRRAKLERWAALLDAHSGCVRPLRGIEFLSPDQRAGLRSEDSPLALALSDPVLRAEGLRNDEFGHGTRFFELTSGEAHRLLCDCHYGGRMTPGELAIRLRFVARHPILSRFIC
ncbi:hypothetical protein [Vineibacter terrae]|uniref:hypothetical protein n=1 Tax=Vineibacter terrae TaxID=2586908 RepID=UPI002E358D54|nr:hypothetical protein [Vineibacter terrae]HEX2892310.1 hypothetical protein [Vineibacter terrae]